MTAVHPLPVRRPLRASILASPCALVLCGALTAGSASAQMSAAQIKAEIAFARGLASEWSFVAMAEEVLGHVESEGVSGKVNEELSVVRCDVYSTAARNERETGRRLELFDLALTSYTDFVTQNAYSDYKSAAEASLVDTAAAYARAIDIALEEVVGEEAQALSEAKIEVLNDAVKLTQELIASLQAIPSDERSERQLRDMQGLMLNRGEMLGEIGGSSKDGTYFFEKAIDSLEEMVFDFGEGTPPALRAYKAIGDVYMTMGLPDEAVNYYQGVVDAALPFDPDLIEYIEEDNGGPLDPDQIAFRYLFLELSMEGLLEALVQLEDTEKACTYALHYYNLQRMEGLNFTPQGYQSVLLVARTLLEAGGFVGGDQSKGETQWFATEEDMKEVHKSRRLQDDAVNFALKIANTVNDENKGNILQVRAQKLISEISDRPGVVVSPEILVQAAQGEYFDGNYDKAIDGLRRVMSKLETREPSERGEYGARVMNFLANSYRRSERELEAAMAFREGITVWAGDPEYDTQNSQGYLAMVKRLAQRSPSDPEFRKMQDEAETLVQRYGDERKQDEVSWNRGMKAYQDKDWDEAIRHFSQVGEDADYYEKALVQDAICRFRRGQADDALKTFENYIDVYVLDANHGLQSPVRIAKRTEALAAAEFFRGLILFMQAEKTGEPALYERIAKLLADYADRYPTQDVLAPWTLQMVMQCHLALGARANARVAVDALVNDWPDNRRTASASTQFYNHLKGIRDADDTAPDSRRELLSEMADFLKVGNSLGKPDFKALRNESRHWYELGEFVEAERVLADISSRFANDASVAKDMARYVYPDLGHALLENGKVADAKAILTPLVMPDGSRPAKGTVVDWARSVAGWLTGGGTQVQEVAGCGGTPDEWQKVIDKLDAIASGGDKWIACDWYEAKLMIVYTYWSWGQSDGRKIESAKNQLQTMDSFLENDSSYAIVEQYCAESEDAELLERLGQGVLQSRYQYMARTLK